MAYIVNTGGFAPSAALNKTLINCWPAVLIVFVTSLIAGFLMWILVSNVLEITSSSSERRSSRHKHGEVSLTPLNLQSLGKTYVTPVSGKFSQSYLFDFQKT